MKTAHIIETVLALALVVVTDKTLLAALAKQIQMQIVYRISM